MMLTLSVKNKLGFVNGTISMLDVASIEYKAWQHCNDLVCCNKNKEFFNS